MDKQLNSIASSARTFAEGPAKLLDRASKGRITPNTVSVVGFLLHLPVAWLISQCYLGYGGLFLLLVAPLDVLDGALARIQKRTSAFGTVLDASLDRAKEVVVYSALAYHFANHSDATGVTLAATALGLSMLVSYIKAKGEMAITSGSKLKPAEINRIFSSGILRFEVRVGLLGIGLIAGYSQEALAIIVLGSAFTCVSRLISIHKHLSKN